MAEVYFTKKVRPGFTGIELGSQPIVIAELELFGGPYVVMAKFDVAPFDPSGLMVGMASFTLTFADVTDQLNCTPSFAFNPSNPASANALNGTVCLTVAGTAPAQEVFRDRRATSRPKAVLSCTTRTQRLRVENVALTAIAVDSIHTV